MTVVVYGGSGWTGSHIARGLLGRGARVILAGRSHQRLDQVNRELGRRAEVRVADMHDPRALGEALSGARVVVNCAGPLGESGPPVLSAAMKAGVNYLDVSGEESHVAGVYAQGDDVVRSGITACPAFAGKGALGDMGAQVIATPVLRVRGIDEIAVAYAHGTGGARNASPASIVSLATEGFYRPGGRRRDQQVVERLFNFPPPFGRGVSLQVQAAENISIPRHLPSRRVTGFISFEPGHHTFNRMWVDLTRLTYPIMPEIRRLFVSEWGRWHLNLYLPPPQHTHAKDTFAVTIEVTAGDRVGRLGIAMNDAYAGSAAIAVVGALRMLKDQDLPPGVVAPAQLCDPHATLDRLQREGVIRIFGVKDGRSPRSPPTQVTRSARGRPAFPTSPRPRRIPD